jgi:tetratricopeptide (TPR) repeat protein
MLTVIKFNNMAGFDKHSLLHLMSYPSEISDKELDELNEITENYPYFQLGHALIAKAKHDKQTPGAHQALTHAAIYVPNRSLLRSLFYEDLKIDYTSPTVSSEDDETNGNEAIQNTDQSNSIDSHEDHSAKETTQHAPETYDPPLDHEDAEDDSEQAIESDEVYNELEENLRKLRENKNQFSGGEDAEDKKKIVDEPVQPNHTDSSSSDNKTPSVAPILMELVDTSSEVNQPIDYGNPEQNELIDRFINFSGGERFKIKETEPHEDEYDLSLEGAHINDDLITENLADIYRRQGKKEKAIEIYHKLIWKFPHKKAYFAEMIEKSKAE